MVVLFPTLPREEPLVGVLLTLPMRWVESPLAFCAAMETPQIQLTGCCKDDVTLSLTPLTTQTASQSHQHLNP